MTPPDCWVPVPIRMRHVQPGDVILSKDGQPWMVDVATIHGRLQVNRMREDMNVTVDLDHVIQVLVPVSERDAVTLTRDQLGAQVESRRLNPEQRAA